MAISVLLLLIQTVSFVRQWPESLSVSSGSCRERRSIREACLFLFQVERRVGTSGETSSSELRLELEMAGSDGGSREWGGQRTKLQGKLWFWSNSSSRDGHWEPSLVINRR